MPNSNDHYWTRPGVNFAGYNPNYDPETQQFLSAEHPEGLVELKERITTMVAKLSSGSKAHKIGVEKLDSLELDPIGELVDQLREVEAMFLAEASSEEPRLTYLHNLQLLKNKILDSLLPYKYGKAPIVTVGDVDREEPIKIILTSE